jgi:signal transduction histidine kinase
MGLITMLTLLGFSNHTLPFTVGGLLAGTQNAVALHLLLSLPDGQPQTRLDRSLVALVYAVTVGSKVLPNLFFDCTNPFGFGCPGNLLMVRDAPDLVVMLDRVGGVVGASVVALVGLRMVVRWWRARPTRRRVLAAPYLAAVPVLVVAVAGLLRLVERFGAVAVLLEPLVLSLLPVGVLLGILRSQARSGVVGSLVTAVEPRSEAAWDRLEPLLAKALGDPSVQLLTPQEASVAEVDGRVRTAVTSRGRTLAVLEHDPELASEPEVLAAVLATASLALENERLGTLARAQLAEVAQSRRRLATAQVEERRRLERDLHDGAQQRLVTVRLMLAMAKEQGADIDLVRQATALVEETTTELRDLARGVHPSVVTEHGLGGAVEALAERAAVPVEVRGEVPRLTELVEVTAYFVVAEALTNVAKHAEATHATVRLEIPDHRLVVTVGDDGRGGADWARGTGLAGLRDRVEAAGGELELYSPPGGGTRLVALLPAHVSVPDLTRGQAR